MSNPLLYALVIVAMIAFGLVAGCDCKRSIHRCASYDEWEEKYDDGQCYRIEAYPCWCKRKAPYKERRKIAPA